MAPSVSYSITVRLEVASRGRAVSEITRAVEHTGGVVTALDVTSGGNERLRVDVTCAARDTAHAEAIVAALAAIDGVTVHKVSDRTFLLHLGGKIEMRSKVPLRNRDDLSMAYTPGVGRVAMAIAENPDDARRLTIKRNSVAVVTDGSAVLGLGNIGPYAALPVMEGKAALFKRFADIDAWPICLDSQDTDEIVRTVQLIAPGFGGINLEDISAPRCFEVERRLRDLLDVPVFHDDQHGTAIVVMAALTNALRVVGKKLPEVRIAMAGAGAAGTAVLKLLLGAGATQVTVADDQGRGLRRPAGPEPEPALDRGAHQPRRVRGRPKRRRKRRRRVHRPVRPAHPHRRKHQNHGRQQHRVRAGQPRARGRPGRGQRVRRGGGHRPQRLPEPDQQRAGLPRRVPRAARRAEPAHHRRHADRRRAGAGRRGLARRDRPALHHPVGLPSGRDLIGRGRGQGRAPPPNLTDDRHMDDIASDALTGRLLVATPLLGDPNFRRTVVLIVEHEPEQGTLGVVLNRPTEVPVGQVLEPWTELATDPSVVFTGGPVSPNSALALALVPGTDEPVGWHPLDGGAPAMTRLGLVDLDAPPGLLAPAVVSLRVYAGYAGWSSGQLKAEIEEGAWYVVPAEPADAFSAEPDRLWPAILRRQGGELAYVATYPDDPSLN